MSRVAPRSGLAAKKFIDVGAGVVDCDYRGPLGIVLFNFSDEDFEVKKGDRVAQFILERICMAPIVEVESLDETERGEGGFGSTASRSCAVNGVFSANTTTTYKEDSNCLMLPVPT